MRATAGRPTSGETQHRPLVLVPDGPFWQVVGALVLSLLSLSQERGMHRGGDADPAAALGRVRGHGGHL